jgi:ribosomal protein S18 acetylase RimI-like enzyme
MQRLFPRRSTPPESIAVRPATIADRGALTRLTERSRRVHFHLDWWSLDDWLAEPDGNVWVASTGERLAGAVIAPRQDTPITWLRLVALADHAEAGELLPALFDAACQPLRQAGVVSLAGLAYPDWLTEHLPRLGFAPFTDVSHYRKEDRLIPERGDSGVAVRAASAEDLPAILANDRAAFDPIWWHTLDSLTRVLRAAAHFIVAEQQGRVVGHAFSDLYAGRGHLIRLVVHPDAQRRGIGARLLSEALTYLLASGAYPITLNTQANNYTSQSLYRRFGFAPTGESTTVMLRAT